MGMHMYVVGYKQADHQWDKMKDVWDVCKRAGIEPPEEVTDFFDDEYPGDNPGMEFDLGQSCQQWNDGDMCEGYQIELSEVPAGVTHIRFICSY